MTQLVNFSLYPLLAKLHRTFVLEQSVAARENLSQKKKASKEGRRNVFCKVLVGLVE